MYRVVNRFSTRPTSKMFRKKENAKDLGEWRRGGYQPSPFLPKSRIKFLSKLSTKRTFNLNVDNFLRTIGLGSGSCCGNCRNRNSFHHRDQAFKRITPIQLKHAKMADYRCSPLKPKYEMVTEKFKSSAFRKSLKKKLLILL